MPRRRSDQTSDEERTFQELFEEVVDRIMTQGDTTYDEVCRAIERMLKAFEFYRGGRFSDIDFSNLATICAYIFRFGAHGAGLVRRRVLDAAEECEELEERLQKSDRLSVVSLGGGPGNDVVGLCSALQELRFRGRLDITVADAVPGWSRSVSVLRDLLTGRRFGNAARLFRENEVDMTFHQARLPNMPDEVESKLEAADVIIVSKLFSIMDGKSKKDTVRALRNKMKKGALLLLIDSPYHDSLWEDFDVLYLSEEQQPYRSTAYTSRFGHTNCVSSKARIAVLRKTFLGSSSDSEDPDESDCSSGCAHRSDSESDHESASVSESDSDSDPEPPPRPRMRSGGGGGSGGGFGGGWNTGRGSGSDVAKVLIVGGIAVTALCLLKSPAAAKGVLAFL